MTVMIRAFALACLFCAMGCGTLPPFHARQADSAEAPRGLSSANQRPPGWLTAGAAPLPSAASPYLSLPEPDLFSAQPDPRLGVPRVEEERSAANHPVEELSAAVTPVSHAAPISPISPTSPIGPAAPATALPVAEPDWKPAGRRVP
jgi:hypothetical protein